MTDAVVAILLFIAAAVMVLVVIAGGVAMAVRAGDPPRQHRLRHRHG
jgi:hypothetical protein